MLSDGTYAFSMGEGAVPAGGALRISVVSVVGGTGANKDFTWLNANVRAIVPGILSFHGVAGHGAGGLRVHGAAATIEIVAAPGGGTAVTHARVDVSGMGQTAAMGIAAALAMVGNPPERLWAGGAGRAPLLQGGSMPTLAAARADTTTIPPADVVGGGGFAAILVAKAGMVQLVTDAATAVPLLRVAGWLAGATACDDRVDAVCLRSPVRPRRSAPRRRLRRRR
jgi:hypothetical protein